MAKKKKVSLGERVLQKEAKLQGTKPPKLPKKLEELPQVKKIADPISVMAPAAAGGTPESAALLHYLRTGMVMMREGKEVVSSMEDVETLLDSYKPSEKLLAATKYLVQPKLSKTLKDRIIARRSEPKKKKGYTPSASTLGQARLRKSQMSGSKKTNEETINEMDSDDYGFSKSKEYKDAEAAYTKKLSSSSKKSTGNNKIIPVKDIAKSSLRALTKSLKKEEVVNELSNTMLKKYLSKSAKAAHDAIVKKDDKKTDKRINGYTSAYNKVKSRGGEVDEHIVKTGSKYRLLSHKGKNLGTFDSHAAAAKHEGEVEWFKKNEEVIFEVDKKKSAKEMKRKYLGKNRGTTLTGKPAHKIDVKPVIGVSDKAIRN